MNEDFKAWLNQNRYGTYNGVEVTPDTKLVSYTFVISIFIITFRRKTRYYFWEVERGKAIAAKICCILCNLVLGWWGFPWGPIWTIKETFCNLINSDARAWREFVEISQEKNL